MTRSLLRFESYLAGGRAHVTALTSLTRQDGSRVMCEARYVIFGQGAVELDMSFDADPALDNLPRLGMEFELAQGMENLEFFAHGPGENYSDRKQSTPLGLYKSTVAAQHFAFIPPSECGGHEGTRHLRISGEETALTLTGARPFHFDVHHATIEEYANARHDHELPRRERAILHIDAAHAGIGGDMAWSSEFAEETKVPAGHYHLRVVLISE
jgi:beta-galactosidase